MPTVALCASFVRQAACAPGRKKVDYFDSTQRGFMLEVRCSGGKTYYQRYIDGRGRERQYKIGHHRRSGFMTGDLPRATQLLSLIT